jgi:translation initiation factor IF-3
VDEDGVQLGVMPTGQALRVAQERGYDLVEVAPMASPPVTRLLDYGQFKYEQARREKEARRNQRSVEFKEIRLKPKIGKGDFDTKVRRAIQFLEEGDRVKVAVQFRGRELTHAYIGRDLLLKFGEQIREHGAIERQPLLEGKSMSIVVASTHKPKPQPVGRDAAQAAGTGPADGQAASDGQAAQGGTAPAPEAGAPAAPETPAPTNGQTAATPPAASAPVATRATTTGPEPVSAGEPAGG